MFSDVGGGWATVHILSSGGESPGDLDTATSQPCDKHSHHERAQQVEDAYICMLGFVRLDDDAPRACLWTRRCSSWLKFDGLSRNQ